MSDLPASTPAPLPYKVQLNLCLESYPCQHYVAYPDGRTGLKGAREIVKMYQDAKLPVPAHFDYLKKKQR